jgi:hypothetical protein
LRSFVDEEKKIDDNDDDGASTSRRALGLLVDAIVRVLFGKSWVG